jgi:hypothetical protein
MQLDAIERRLDGAEAGIASRGAGGAELHWLSPRRKSGSACARKAGEALYGVASASASTPSFARAVPGRLVRDEALEILGIENQEPGQVR